MSLNPNTACIINATAAISAVVILVFSLYIIRNYTQETQKSSKKDYWGKKLLILSFITTIITLSSLSMARQRELNCNVYSSRPLNYVYNSSYLLQLCQVILITFYRMYLVFRGTPRYALKKCTIRIITTLSLLMVITSSCSYINHLAVLVVISLFIYIILLIILSSMFVSKLRHLMSREEDADIQKIVWKIYILFMNSIFTTFINITWYQFYMSSGIGWMVYVTRILSILDIITNQISVTLTLKVFNSTYSRLCGCQERVCRCCCTLLCASRSCCNCCSCCAHQESGDDDNTTSDGTVDIEISPATPMKTDEVESNKPTLVARFAVNSNSTVVKAEIH